MILAIGLPQERAGVLCLGALVGFLLAFSLFNTTNVGLRAVVAVLGIALGGAPVVFMGATDEKWVYPIGLVQGFLGYALINSIGRKRFAGPPSVEKLRHARYAVFDILVVSVLALLIVGFVLLSGGKPQPANAPDPKAADTMASDAKTTE
jgi:hypothetical protein